MCREQGTARSAGEVASSARRHAPSKSHTYVFDKTSQASSISSGGLCDVGGAYVNSQGIIASRESGLSFLPRRRAFGARNRASAAPRCGGDATVPSYEARRRRSPSGRVSPHRDERDDLAAPKSSGAADTSCERRRRRSARRPSGRRAVEACWLRTAKSPTSLCRSAPYIFRRVHSTGPRCP